MRFATETESLETLDAFAEALLAVAREAHEEPELLRQAPVRAPVRRLDEATAEVAYAESPEQLLKQNAALGINLIRPREDQVIRAEDDVERRLAAKRFGQLFSTAEPEQSRQKESN